MLFEKWTHKKPSEKNIPSNDTVIKANDLLVQLNINSIQKLIEFSESNETNIYQKINCYKEIFKYTYSRFKSQELRVQPIEIVFVSLDNDK